MNNKMVLLNFFWILVWSEECAFFSLVQTGSPSSIRATWMAEKQQTQYSHRWFSKIPHNVLDKWDSWTSLQGRSRDAEVESGHVETGGKGVRIRITVGPGGPSKRQQLWVSPALASVTSGSAVAALMRMEAALGVTLHRRSRSASTGTGLLSPGLQQVCWNFRNFLASLQALAGNKHLCTQRMVAVITFSWVKKKKECQEDKHFVNPCMSPAFKLWVCYWDISLFVYSLPQKLSSN